MNELWQGVILGAGLVILGEFAAWTLMWLTEWRARVRSVQRQFDQINRRGMEL